MDTQLEYFGPKPGEEFDRNVVRVIKPTVISLVSPGKHYGKTLLSLAIVQSLTRRGRKCAIASIERSPPWIEGRPNAKSDFIRIKASRISAVHLLRVGDLTPGIARLDRPEGLCTLDADSVIIDNSGASVAPVEPDVLIGIGANPLEIVPKGIFNGSPSVITLRCASLNPPVGRNSYSIACRLGRIYAKHSSTDREALGLFLHRCLTVATAQSACPSVQIVDCVRSEGELRRVQHLHPTIQSLVTDDYSGERFTETFNLVHVLDLSIAELKLDLLKLE